MHLYVVAKGTKNHLKKWQEDLGAIWVRRYQNGKPLTEDGKEMYHQIGVRPVQLFEISFPKEAQETVLNHVGYSGYILNRYPSLKLISKVLKKFLKLKPVPKPKAPNELMQPNQMNKAVAIVPIGLKEDVFSDDGMEQL